MACSRSLQQLILTVINNISIQEDTIYIAVKLACLQSSGTVSSCVDILLMTVKISAISGLKSLLMLAGIESAILVHLKEHLPNSFFCHLFDIHVRKRYN